MTQQILDAIDEEKDDKFSRKSFYQFIISFSTYLPLIITSILSWKRGIQSEVLSMIFGLLMIIGFVFCILGLINGIKSVIKKESPSYKKYVGLLGNTILVSIMLMMIVVNLIDINNAFNN